MGGDFVVLPMHHTDIMSAFSTSVLGMACDDLTNLARRGEDMSSKKSLGGGHRLDPSTISGSQNPVEDEQQHLLFSCKEHSMAKLSSNQAH